jgi:hypothetical protein
MKITNINQIHDILAAVDKCKGDVQLRFSNGDWFSLKSRFSQYVAMGALISDCGDELELFCLDKSDEAYFFDFLNNHPEVR